MKDFANLFIKLDQTTKTTEKVEALANYFNEAEDDDKLWTIAILSHRRPKRIISTTLLKEMAVESAEIPSWLFEESYHVVGDLAESIALMLGSPMRQSSNEPLHVWIRKMIALREESDEMKKTFIKEAWDSMSFQERFVLNKLITGGFRMGISQKLMTRALSQTTKISEEELAHRLMGDWMPQNTNFQDLIYSDDPLADASKPYPFYLAYALDQKPEALGDVNDWIAEWKWDGIRAQLIFRQDEIFIWSRGEELVTDQFPEFLALKEKIPNGSVLDGEILVLKEGKVGTFGDLQTRLGRKKISKKQLQENPVALFAYDLLEWSGIDIRPKPLKVRRTLLEAIMQKVNQPNLIQCSPVISSVSWQSLEMVREQSRAHQAEGIMLKRGSAPYLSGRRRGDWWKWKIDPLTIDAVMIYAQRGHGRRANLYTDYTFALWEGDQLIPFAKAYSGLTDKEFKEITAFVNKNTVEKFGPVRSVKPDLVFEIGFEGVQYSTRHKSGVSVRFPRILRWRKDKPTHEANHLADLKKLI